MTKVEQVARAVCIASGEEPETWAYDPHFRQRCRRIALAAIDALSKSAEDNDFMEKVSERAHDGRFSKSGETYPVLRNFTRAFFDAALEEGEDE